MTTEEARKILDDAVASVAEHFDSVIIVATRDYPDDERLTQLLNAGRGNWYAQRGSIREILKGDDAAGLAYQLKKNDE